MENIDLTDKQRGVIVAAYNAAKETGEKMPVSEFEDSEGDIEFWRDTYIQLYYPLIFDDQGNYHRSDDDTINIGRHKFSLRDYRLFCWELTANLIVNMELSEAVKDPKALLPFMDKDGHKIQCPDDKHEVRLAIFGIMNSLSKSCPT